MLPPQHFLLDRLSSRRRHDTALCRRITMGRCGRGQRIEALNTTPPPVGLVQHLRQSLKPMFTAGIEAALLEQSFDGFFRALLDMIPREAGRDCQQRSRAGQIFVGHFQKRGDAPRVRHTAECLRQARLEVRRRRPDWRRSMHRACMERRRSEAPAQLPAGRLDRNPGVDR